MAKNPVAAREAARRFRERHRARILRERRDRYHASPTAAATDAYTLKYGTATGKYAPAADAIE